MKKFFVVTLQLALVAALMATPSTASKRRPKKQPDVYSATEEGPSEEVISSAPGYRGQPVQEAGAVPEEELSSVAQAPAKPRVRHVAVKVSAETAAPAPASGSGYDTVPNSQAEPLVRRLRLVQELITKYGRAYDYRSLTVTALQEILAQLDSESAQAAEVRHRASTRNEMKREIEATPAAAATEVIPAPEDSSNSIGSEAPVEN